MEENTQEIQVALIGDTCVVITEVAKDRYIQVTIEQAATLSSLLDDLLVEYYESH